MKKARRLWLVIPWIGFALLAAAWTVYWNVAANMARQQIEAAFSALADDGAQAGYAAVEARGFPVLLRLEMRELFLEPSDHGWRAETARMDIHVNLLNPAHVIYKAEAPIAIEDADGARSTLDASTLMASIRHRNGVLAQAGLEADGLTLDDPAKPGALYFEKLVANVRPDPRGGGAYQLSLDAEGVMLARLVRSFEPFGRDIAALRVRAVIEHATPLLELAPDDPLGAWRETDGRVRFEGLALDWGPLQATGEGHATLDAARRLEGELALTIPRPGPALAALAQSEGVSSDARRALQVAGALVGGELMMDLAARDGVLTLRGAPVRTLDPIY